MKFIVLAWTLALLLAGCELVRENDAPVIPATEPVFLTSDQQRLIKAGIAENLPGRADLQFGEISGARTEDDTYFVCGDVDAKSSAGGYYTGKKPFLGKLVKGQFSVMNMGGADYQNASVDGQCHMYGVR